MPNVERKHREEARDLLGLDCGGIDEWIEQGAWPAQNWHNTADFSPHRSTLSIFATALAQRDEQLDALRARVTELEDAQQGQISRCVGCTSTRISYGTCDDCGRIQ